MVYFRLVFVAGDFDLDDVFCASWTVVIVTAASFFFLQFRILVVCVLCIYASRASNKKDSDAYSNSGSSSSSSGAASTLTGPTSVGGPASHLGGTGLYHTQLNTGSLSLHRENSAHTLRSLRTALRD